MSFLRTLPSYGRFRLLQYGVALGLLAPVTAFILLLRTFYYAGDYVTASRQATRLMQEGMIVAVPIGDQAPRYIDLRDSWSVPLKLPGGSEVSYLRGEKPEGLKQLYFIEHPEISGTVTRPRIVFEMNGPREVLVEVSASPDWSETFRAVAGGSFLYKTSWLATLTLLTGVFCWLAWKSYWWMKGGRSRSRNHSRRRHRHSH